MVIFFGYFEVQNVAVTDKPVATLVDGGVEVTFVWSLPEGVDSGSFLAEFILEPQNGLQISANMSHFIEAGDDEGEEDPGILRVSPLELVGLQY